MLDTLQDVLILNDIQTDKYTINVSVNTID